MEEDEPLLKSNQALLMTYDKIGALLIHTVKRIGFERYNPKEADKSTSSKMTKLFVWQSALQTMAHTQNRSQNQAVNDTWSSSQH